MPTDSRHVVPLALAPINRDEAMAFIRDEHRRRRNHRAGRHQTEGSLTHEQRSDMVNELGSKSCGYLLSNPARHQHIRAPFAESEGGSMVAGYLWSNPGRRNHIRPASASGRIAR